MKKPMINVQSFHDGREGKMNSRRQFLKIGGLAVVGSSLFLYSCEEDGITDEEINALDAKGVDNKKRFNLGTGDIAILNYAYILEQLEAAFYTGVVNGDYFNFKASAEEKEILRDIYNHEIIHREFLKVALNSITGTGRVAPDLEFDFSDVKFDDRTSVLTFSQILEDTGVSAYNGAGKLLESVDYLLLAGKIVSVEARHASAIRDLIDPRSANFAADEILVDLGGSGVAYDKATPPLEVLAAVKSFGFISTEFNTNNFPSA